MKKMALKVAYIGTDFYGFQRQPDVKTVEGELIKALKEANLVDNLKSAKYAIAGRTDRGVHALGNVVSFITDKGVIINQINDFLPKSIRILGKASVHFGFKPRYAISRHYRYVIANESSLDIELMKEAARRFKGTHNFQNFSKRSERDPIRTIKSINIFKENNLVIIDVIGESFLWNMVRKIVTILFMIGNSEFDIMELDELFDPETETNIVPMPAEGLILVDTEYKSVKFEYDEYARDKFLAALEKEYRYNKTIAAAEKIMINKLIG